VSGAQGSVIDSRGDDLGFYFEGVADGTQEVEVLIGFRPTTAEDATIRLDGLSVADQPNSRTEPLTIVETVALN